MYHNSLIHIYVNVNVKFRLLVSLNINSINMIKIGSNPTIQSIFDHQKYANANLNNAKRYVFTFIPGKNRHGPTQFGQGMQIA